MSNTPSGVEPVTFRHFAQKKHSTVSYNCHNTKQQPTVSYICHNTHPLFPQTTPPNCFLQLPQPPTTLSPNNTTGLFPTIATTHSNYFPKQHHSTVSYNCHNTQPIFPQTTPPSCFLKFPQHTETISPNNTTHPVSYNCQNTQPLFPQTTPLNCFLQLPHNTTTISPNITTQLFPTIVTAQSHYFPKQHHTTVSYNCHNTQPLFPQTTKQHHSTVSYNCHNTQPRGVIPLKVQTGIIM
jgi:hypothetical protein